MHMHMPVLIKAADRFRICVVLVAIIRCDLVWCFYGILSFSCNYYVEDFICVFMCVCETRSVHGV